MAEDRWDDERGGNERRGEDEPQRVERRHDGPYYSDRGWGEAPRIGPTGMGARHIGNSGTSGSYYEDYDRRAEYGGYQGGVPGWGPGLGRRRAARSEPEPDRREAGERRRAMEEERRIGGPYTDYGRAFGGFGAGGGYTPDPREGVARHGRSPYDRGADEIRAFFGDADAERRLDWDSATEGPHRGRGPKGYRRSDDRIREDVSDRLTDDAFVDASEVEVEVAGGEVTLNGWVASRAAKRRAEDCADSVMGVSHVQNNLRVGAPAQSGALGQGVDPRVAAVTEGKDADDAAKNLPH